MLRTLRCILFTALAVVATPPSIAALGDNDALMWRFMNRFITPNGAVVDTQNQNMSHSEGQGYGMLIALAANDQRRFEQIWQWTRTHLAVRKDGLLAWSWNRQKNALGDANAATDGDILVAWALLRAAERWKDRKYRQAALRHINAIEALVVQHGGRWLIKPGPSGFMPDGDAVHINLSYWVFPALQAFARVNQDPWQDLINDGVDLGRTILQQRRVIPDWIRVNKQGALASSAIVDAPNRSGFDAIRVPLYLHWANLGGEVAQQHWQNMQHPYVDDGYVLVRHTTEPTVYLAGRHAGYAAISALIDQRVQRWPSSTLAHDYYPAALQLLSRLAAAEGARQ